MSNLIGFVKQYCSDKIKSESQNQELLSLIRNTDSKKRFLLEEIKNNINFKNKQCQVNINNQLIQIRQKNQYSYDLPTKSLLINADIDWQKVEKKIKSKDKNDIQEIFKYIFNKFQSTRRKTKQIIEIKPSGKRTQKKYPVIEIPDNIKNSIDNYLTLSNQSKSYRAKKRKLNSQDDNYINTIEFLKANKLKTQSFNINVGNNEKKRLTIKKVEVAKIKSLSGRQFKSLIEKSIQKTTNNFNKETFIDTLMDLVFQHLDNTKSKREKLVYEIE